MAYRERSETINLTRAEILTLISNNDLIPNYEYYISDRDIWLTARSNNTFAPSGQRSQRIIKNSWYTPQILIGFFTSNILGIYGQTINQGSVPVSNDVFGGVVYFAIWGGRMWQRNSSGTDGGQTNQGEITSGWTVIPFTNDDYYETKIFDIVYDIVNDTIVEQKDDRNNNVINQIVSGFETVNMTDWGNVLIRDNYSKGIYNNFDITLPANITSNHCTGLIFFNQRQSSISFNICISIHTNVCTQISSNIVSNNIQNNNISFQITQNNVGGSISNNTNNGRIIVNLLNGSIFNNTSPVTNIDFNTINSRNSNNSINDNSNSGNIRNNFCSRIANNFNVGAILDNRCSVISDNGNLGSIAFNNCFFIQNNTNSQNITSNAIRGSILDNSCRLISENQCNGDISLNLNTNCNIARNTNAGRIVQNNVNSIENNGNLGEIINNVGPINIEYNMNRGPINDTTTNVGITGVTILRNHNNGSIIGVNFTAFAVSIRENINNGNIGPGNYATTISDPIVNK